MARKLVSTDAAAVALGITPAGVRQLFRRRILTRYGTVKRALVDLGECESRKLGGTWGTGK